MAKIRQNALLYSVDDYKRWSNKINHYRRNKRKVFRLSRNIKRRMQELEEKDITIQKLADDERQNLGHLKTIESYLNQALDEHQRILNSHFDLKNLIQRN